MPSHQPTSPSVGLATVRYSLPALLREVEIERSAAAFAMEKLDQVEITKMFAKRKTRRVQPPRK
ncbi:MAG TPA: hypothetical protein VG936_13875 [Lacunisphaera sp.]|nr:hypothetical protein [Lacunisphaera sp.]